MSAALASDYERGVHLESDWFYRSIRSGFVAPWLPDAHSQNAAVMVAAADAAAAYADAGYSVVWDGIVGPWFLDQVARRLEAREIGVQYLVLR
ncbi:MAG: ATP-binding protein, partial [bacterium]|nr:ATP-binding protein [bacterium]